MDKSLTDRYLHMKILADLIFDGEEVLKGPHSIVVEDGVFVSVTAISPEQGESSASTPEYDFDYSGKFIMPGLIDCHSHPAIVEEDYQMVSLRMGEGEKALLAMHRMREMLLHGWTTIRVAGDPGQSFPSFEAREYFKKYSVSGPTVVGAGHYISVTGGGGDLNQVHNCHVMRMTSNSGGFDGAIADGPIEMRKAVRNEIKRGTM